jgi:hypothetical protein
MSFFDTLFGTKGEYKTDPYGAFNPEQTALNKQLGPLLQSTLSNGAPTYTGNYTAPLTASEQEVLNNQNRLSNMVSGWSSSFQPGYINPETNATELSNLNSQFYGSGNSPGAKALAEEQFAGPSGSYWGSARAKGVLDTYNDTVTTPYQNWRSTALQNSYNNALAYSNNVSTLNTANEALQQVPRLIEQYGLDQQYKEWTRGQEANQKYINSALDFLNISSATSTYTPGKTGLLDTIVSSAMSGVGSSVGNYTSQSLDKLLGTNKK